MKITETNDFKIFFNSFIACALWSSTDDSGEPLDTNFDRDDINEEGLEILKAYAICFYAQCHYFVSTGADNQSFDQLGHDFWLTSVGHGAGFWDGDWPIYGDTLTKLCENSGLEHLDLLEYLEVK